ncbi:hypothetical protein ES705_23938 [subsurface metagenome]
MQLLGIDLGSSSVKVSVIDAETGKCLSSATYPDLSTQVYYQEAYDRWKQYLDGLVK